MLSLGPIARHNPADLRASGAASQSQSSTSQPGTPGRRSSTVSSPPAAPTGTGTPTVIRATSAHPAPPTAASTTVGCACCGRLATAEAHLARSTTAAASGFDRAVSAYRRNAAGDDEPVQRSIVS